MRQPYPIRGKAGAKDIDKSIRLVNILIFYFSYASRCYRFKNLFLRSISTPISQSTSYVSLQSISTPKEGGWGKR